jgi:hypothetical protein
MSETSDLYLAAGRSGGLRLPAAAAVAILFGLLGLVLSAAILPHYPVADVFWAVTNLE